MIQRVVKNNIQRGILVLITEQGQYVQHISKM